jgi:hypothetical protein
LEKAVYNKSFIMFKGAMSDLAGTADNCSPVSSDKWPAMPSMAFLQPCDKIMFILKSMKARAAYLFKI